MPAEHLILELRIGRDTTHTPESAAQLFASLPQLHNSWWYRLLKRDEHTSFELLVDNQTIYFLCYIPTRLAEYFRSILTASYPEIMIQELEFDPLQTLTNLTNDPNTHQFHTLTTGQIKLKKSEYLPFKDFTEFKETDPLSPLISTLSQLKQDDFVVIQYVVSPAGKTLTAPTEHPQKSLIEKKTSSTLITVAIKIAIASQTKNRSELLLETLASSFQVYNKQEGNHLSLGKTHLFHKHFLKTMLARSYSRAQQFSLSLDEMASIYHLPTPTIANITNLAWGKTLLGEPPNNLPIVYSGMDPALKGDINPYARTIYKNSPSIYGLQRSDRRRHMYVIGKTGTGKSTLLANMAINDLKNGEGLCVIDPHGDLVEMLLNYIPSKRINDVIYFDPSDDQHTVQLNLFEGKNVVHRELIASGIVSVFKKLYAYSWGPRLEYILRNTLLTLLHLENSRMSDILELLTNDKFRKKTLEKLDDDILNSFWHDEYNKMQDRQRTESIASILNKVGQFVSSPLVRNVVNARKSSFDIEDAMNEGKIILVNLSQGKLGEDNAALLGAMLITKVQLAAMSRVYQKEENRKDFYLYVDEFQNFATDSFIKILSEARKYRLNLILANQYIAQIPEEVQKAIFGNCGTLASFVMGAEDAQVFMQEYGNKYTHQDLVSLGKYQIINKITIDNIVSQPFPASTLNLAKSSNQNKDKVVRVSKERYARKRS